MDGYAGLSKENRMAGGAKILKFIGMLALALLSWAAVVVMLTFTAKPGQPLAVVTLPGRGLEVVAIADGSFEGRGGPLVITRSQETGFVRRLYRAGALLVIDARVVLACHDFLARSKARS
jgi:hypothetical protein